MFSSESSKIKVWNSQLFCHSVLPSFNVVKSTITVDIIKTHKLVVLNSTRMQYTPLNICIQFPFLGFRRHDNKLYITELLVISLSKAILTNKIENQPARFQIQNGEP